MQLMEENTNIKRLVYANIRINENINIWKCNLDHKDIGPFVQDLFWKDVFMAWSLFKDEMADGQIIWLNSAIRIEGKTNLLEGSG